MSGLRYAEVSQRELKFLDLTSLTVEEFAQLVPAFEEAFQERMKEWRLDGKKRSGRPYTTYANCPLPTSEDRLLFIWLSILPGETEKKKGEHPASCFRGSPKNPADSHHPKGRRPGTKLRASQKGCVAKIFKLIKKECLLPSNKDKTRKKCTRFL